VEGLVQTDRNKVLRCHDNAEERKQAACTRVRE